MRTRIAELSWPGGGSYKDLEIRRSVYQHGLGVAVQLCSYETGEVISLVSINLYEIGHAPSPGCFWIKNYSEHTGLGDALVKAGVIEPTDKPTAKYGPWDASANEYRFTPEYRYEPEDDDA